MNTWKNAMNLTGYSENGIVSKVIFKGGKIETTLFCMAKGTELSEHTSLKQGIVFVLEGKGIFKLEGKDIPMETGIVISMRANAVHSLKAIENTAFLLFLSE